MDKTTQDLAWSVLPKEFKEEVKRVANIYNWRTSMMLGGERALASTFLNEFIKLFGRHNLTSDAEGVDEMLYVKAKTIHEMYAANMRIMTDFRGKIDGINADLINHVLRQLFGAKCRPNETRDKREKREIKRELNEDNFAKSDAPSTGGKEVNFTSKAQPGTNCNGYDDRRLQIAAMAMAGLLANPNRDKRYEEYIKNAPAINNILTQESFVALIALAYADAIIREAQEGGSDGE